LENTILYTKFFIPDARPKLVHRDRLVDILNAGVHRNLSLISAPAGFGKTTLVIEWLNSLGIDANNETQPEYKIAWLSLDESDNDLVRFLTYLISALNQLEGIEANFGKSALSMLQFPQLPSTKTILTTLINDVAAISFKTILVLDDYHLIEAEPIHDALCFLLDNIPPRIHLVIATREDPHLPLARLRAKDQLTELRASDLRFTPSEVTEFLSQVMGLTLSADNVAELETRTEGWIAGLQLAAISLQGHKNTSSLIKSFTGSHQFVLDYLIDEVLNRQPENVRNFLLQTAILDRLTGSLCDAVTGQKNGQITLEKLNHANLFIFPLDSERRWYRYHHLFSDLLRQRFVQTQSEKLPILQSRASTWFEQNGFIGRAIEHALHGEDFERAANLFGEHIDAIWQRGEHTILQHQFAKLPLRFVFSKPNLCIFHAWNLFASGQQDAAELSLQAAEKALGNNTDLGAKNSVKVPDYQPDSESLKIHGRCSAIRAFLAFYRGDTQEIKRYSLQALEYLPEQDLTWRSTAIVALGDAYSFMGDMKAASRVRSEALKVSKSAGNFYMILISSMKRAVTLRQQGQLEHVINICKEQLQLANEIGLSQTAVVGWLLAIWGEVLVEFNDLDGALNNAKKGTEQTERGNDVAMICWSNLCLIRVLFSRYDFAGAEEVIQKIEDIARENLVPPWIITLMTAWQVRIYLAQDKLDAASQLVGERGLDADEDPTYLREMEYIAFTRVLLAQGKLAEAARLLQRLLNAAETGGRISRVIEIMMLKAFVLQAQGSTDQAITMLEQTLTLAEPGGFIRSFVDEGPQMARLLYESLSRGILPEYVQKLLAAFPIEKPKQSNHSLIDPQDDELIEPLTDREVEVLQLIAEGLSRKEISTHLFISLNTVKAHTRNIFQKLGVRSQLQAVTKAQVLGLLERD